MVRAKEERSDETRDHCDLNELAHHEQAHLHGAVFGEVPSNQFGLGLGHIERHALVLSHQGDQEDHEHVRLHEHAPTGHKAQPHIALLLSDKPHVDRAVDHEDSENRHAHEDLVRDHLAARPERTHERVLVVG